MKYIRTNKKEWAWSRRKTEIHTILRLRRRSCFWAITILVTNTNVRVWFNFSRLTYFTPNWMLLIHRHKPNYVSFYRLWLKPSKWSMILRPPVHYVGWKACFSIEVRWKDRWPQMNLLNHKRRRQRLMALE